MKRYFLMCLGAWALMVASTGSVLAQGNPGDAGDTKGGNGATTSLAKPNLDTAPNKLPGAEQRLRKDLMVAASATSKLTETAAALRASPNDLEVKRKFQQATATALTARNSLASAHKQFVDAIRADKVTEPKDSPAAKAAEGRAKLAALTGQFLSRATQLSDILVAESTQKAAKVSKAPNAAAQNEVGAPVKDQFQGQRYLHVQNDSGKAVTLWVQVCTMTDAGKWAWLPAGASQGAKASSYRLAPGQATYLGYQGKKLAGSKIRFWVQWDGGEITTYRNRDLWLVPEVDAAGNHLYSATAMETYPLKLTP